MIKLYKHKGTLKKYLKNNFSNLFSQFECLTLITNCRIGNLNNLS